MSTSAGERAYAHVKGQILRGAFDGGELIAEGQVADSLGMSRTPVREAFLRLETEGLLRLYPKRGALVVPVSPREVDDVVEARQLIERFAVTKVITRGRHVEVAAGMRAILDQQRAAAHEHDADRFNDLDREFHAALVEAPGNAIISRQYEGLRDRQVRMGVTALQRDPQRLQEILDEHERICRLLEAADADGLGAFLDGHVARTGEVARS
jgi:DNA-binding GntR family transcriptional regulator